MMIKNQKRFSLAKLGKSDLSDFSRTLHLVIPLQCDCEFVYSCDEDTEDKDGYQKNGQRNVNRL